MVTRRKAVNGGIGARRCGGFVEGVGASYPIVGQIARATPIPAGAVRRVSVESIVWRDRSQTPPEYRDRLQVDGWWVVLPMIVLD